MIMESNLHPSSIPLPPGSDAEGKHHTLPPPPPPSTDRRPRRLRARQVSSRYLSPSPSSSSSSSSETQHLAASPRSGYPDENQPLASTRRSSETPLPLPSSHTKPPGTLKKRAVVRLFADNNHPHHHDAAEQPPLPRPADQKRRPRPGTPMARCPVADATSLPRRNPRPPTPARACLFPSEANSGDNRLEETSSENSFSDAETCSVSSPGGLCDSPPLLPPSSCRSRLAADVRSSMPEADLLPTMSTRRQEGAEDASCRASTNPLSFRSLSSAITGRQQQHPFSLSKSVNRPLFSSKPSQPPSAKPGTDVKKGMKSSVRQEDIHALRLLDNCYVQWRFINSKARAAIGAQRFAAEKLLHGLSLRIAELQSSVTEKKIQLEQLKRRENLLSIIHGQMLHLNEWTILEDDYSSSLLGATKALQDASLRLPISGNVRVDIRELKVVLDSALLVLESLSPCAGRFLPKAEDIDDVASDLASVIGAQRAMVEECGNLLSDAHKLQVKECSLRTQLIQVKQSHVQPICSI